MSEYFKKKYFNQNEKSDVFLKTKSLKIPSHKIILSSRCEYLNLMVNGDFMESSSSTIELDLPDEILIPFIEYLYTGHIDISESNVFLLIEYSNKFGITRIITLCEIFLSKWIERETSLGIENAEVNIIGLLNFSQLHNSKQLIDFCLHLITTNYHKIKKRKEWDDLNGDHLKYVEKHQWPPKSYFEERKVYESKIKESKNGQSCQIM
jgi:hypothetical protein